MRKLLQIIFTILALVVILIGLLGMMGVDNLLYSSIQLPREPLLDTNMRFYSGVWLVLGIALLLTVGALEKHVILYRVLLAMIFVGGIGRLLSLLVVGMPPLPLVGLMLLELVGSPLLLYGHHRVVNRVDHSG